MVKIIGTPSLDKIPNDIPLCNGLTVSLETVLSSVTNQNSKKYFFEKLHS